MSNREKYNREKTLQARLNSFLSGEFCLPQSDYYSQLSADGLINSKAILSDINNILTMKVTLSFIHWVSERLDLDPDAKEEASRKCIWGRCYLRCNKL